MGVSLDTDPDWVGWLVFDTIVATVFVAEARLGMWFCRVGWNATERLKAVLSKR